MPRTWAEIDAGALRRNLWAMRARLHSDAQLCLAVKANAYGHGALAVAQACLGQGADWLAVASLEEGAALRSEGITAPILTIAPVASEEAADMVANDLDVTLESPEMARALSDAAVRLGKQARVHIEIDTGMARFGVAPAAFQALAETVRGLPGLLWVGVSHHFVDSLTDPERTQQQQALFQRLTASLPENIQRHEANSSAVFTTDATPNQLARVGIGAYGYGCPPSAGLEPVLRWRAEIRSLRVLSAGETVSYCGRFTAPEAMTIGTLSVGYGDGYPRHLSNQGYVMLENKPAKILGTICMDQTVIDLTDHQQARVGNSVDLIGPGLSADNLAETCGTIAYEILTQIMPRVPRVLVNA